MLYDGIEYEERLGRWVAVKNVSNFGVSEIRIPPEIGNKRVIAIADHVFADNEDLEVITIPQWVTEIGNYAFAGCKNLRCVKEIECKYRSEKGLQLNKCAFQDCRSLTEILLSSWIVLHGEKIFQRCHKLERIGITGENKVYGSIPNQCFQACISLEHLTIEKPTCIIQNNAFNWCSSLKTITFFSHNVMCEDEDTWDSLYRSKLRCLPNCNLVDLGYEGAEIEVFEKK